MNRQIPWLRVFVEGVVIVGSILMAFGIEAGWDQRNQRLELRLELQNVAQELAENRERVLFQLDLVERIAAAGTAVDEIMELNHENSVTNLPDTLVYLGTAASPTLDVSLGALEALIASGRLASVDDLGVRRRLAGLRARFEDVVENQVRAAEFADTQIRPATRAYVDDKPANRVSAAFWAEERIVGRGLVHRSRVDFPNTLAFRNLVGFRTLLFVTTIPELRSVLRELDELLEMLRELT